MQGTTEIDLCYPVAPPLAQGVTTWRNQGGDIITLMQLLDRHTPPMHRLMRCDSVRLPKELVWLLQVQRWKFVATPFFHPFASE